MVDKTSPKLMTAKVMAVDPNTNTFIVMAKDKQYTVSAPPNVPLPKVGGIYDITYCGPITPGEPVGAINLNSSRSNVD